MMNYHDLNPRNNQYGFTRTVVIAVTIAILLLGGVIFWIPSNSSDDSSESANSSSTSQQSAEAANSDTRTQSEANTEAAGTNQAVFDVNAFKFGYSMDTITVDPGTEVTINVTSSDGNHDWVIDAIPNAQTSVIGPGESDSITFTVPESAAGQTFTFYCSVGNHRAQGMEGNFVVSQQ